MRITENFLQDALMDKQENINIEISSFSIYYLIF